MNDALETATGNPAGTFSPEPPMTATACTFCEHTRRYMGITETVCVCDPDDLKAAIAAKTGTTTDAMDARADAYDRYDTAVTVADSRPLTDTERERAAKQASLFDSLYEAD